MWQVTVLALSPKRSRRREGFRSQVSPKPKPKADPDWCGSRGSVQAPTLRANSVVVDGSMSMPAPSVAAEALSLSAGSSGSTETHEKKMERYRKGLNPSIVMAETLTPQGTLGVSGRVMWQASTTLASMKKSKEKSASPDCIMLTSYLDVAKRAARLANGNIQKLSKKQRDEIVAGFCDEGVKFAKETMCNLVMLTAKEVSITSEPAVDEFVDVVFPVSLDEDFNPSAPRLRGVPAHECLKSSALQTCIAEAANRLVQAKDGFSIAPYFASKVLDQLQEAGQSAAGRMRIAVEHATDMMRCMLAITHPNTGERDTSVADVDSVWSATIGPRWTLKQALGLAALLVQARRVLVCS